MSYSGAETAKTTREELGKALASLQQDPNITPEALNVAQNMARAVGALFEAERASSEPDGKASVKSALGFLSQTLALLQDLRGENPAVFSTTATIANAIGQLFPLSTQASSPPGSTPGRAIPPTGPGFGNTPGAAPHEEAAADTLHDPYQQQAARPPAAQPPPLQPAPQAPQAPAAQPAPQANWQQPAPAAFSKPAPAPSFSQPPVSQRPVSQRPVSQRPVSQRPVSQRPVSQRPVQPAPGASAGGAPGSYRDSQDRETVEANIGATTESNFFVGFSGEISHGGVFISTYNIFPRGTAMRALVTLPGGLSTEVLGHVRFVRDPMDFGIDSEPGMGIAFDGLDATARDLILRFIKKRPPMFYDE